MLVICSITFHKISSETNLSFLILVKLFSRNNFQELIIIFFLQLCLLNPDIDFRI